ncbi:hypothetical protein AUK40_06065 [Candidatus Wirthbacteria bacterium CG2_30_54_11]|uniref:ATPase AAA-type core domain-containing protein n=1 Tax=Candidatus Wirthbacteria bacterium CG2_30_54_11 TaxID=1817892 RepID=A0A1J5IVU0_9BACT|nr:MAG: hypothetical protein AUK40_06065 [Candidatus Wirthbacteria bacterium CG2_30_54_11]
MIRKVKFSNFYSFSKEQEINFLATKKKTYDYYQSETGDQITKIAGFIGKNASGKTNVMRLFSFLGYFVCREINDDSALVNEIAKKTFFNNADPSSFSIEFENSGSIYFYDFSLQEKIIINESLFVQKIQKGARKEELFTRQATSIIRINKEYFKNLTEDAFPKVREDVSFIAFIKKSTYSIDIINSVYDYFSGFKTNINERGGINQLPHQINTLQMYLRSPDLKQKVENFICRFDIGLHGFEIKKQIQENGISSISVKGIHAAKGNNKLDFNYESTGTQSLFFAMANILSALNNNNIVIIDEIEFGLHPEALNKLIGYFIDENKNKKSQFIFSSNSLGFMNKLDMHQIYLVDKKTKGSSSVLRLNKVPNIRPDENFLAKYLSGAYGAFPKIRV